MASAAQYTAWAGELRRLADDLHAQLDPVIGAWEAGPVVGGNLALVVHRSVEAAADHVGAIGLELDDLAATCAQRAAVVAAAAAMAGTAS